MKRTDAGLYKCKAWNYAGSGEGEMYINVSCKLESYEQIKMQHKTTIVFCVQENEL